MTGTSQGGTEVIPSRSMRPRKEELKNEADAALVSAEEKMLDDDEIASVDDFGNPVADTVKIENRNLTVAIVKSVVDVVGESSSSSAQDDDGEGQQKRYGLRARRASDPPSVTTSPVSGEDTTRRRPDDKSEELTGQALVESGGSVPLPTPVASPPPLQAVPLVEPTPLPAPIIAAPLLAVPRPALVITPVLAVPQPTSVHAPVLAAPQQTQFLAPVLVAPQPTLLPALVPAAPQAIPLPVPVLAAPQPTPPPALAAPPPQRPPRLPVVVAKPPVVPALRVPSRPPVHTSHGVPNPLANLATPIKQEPPQIPRQVIAAVPKLVVRPSYQSAVPCPLPAVLCPIPTPVPPPICIKVEHVPSPLPAPVITVPVATAVATVSMDLLPTKRGRILPVSLDQTATTTAAGLDFPDMSVDNIGSGFCPSPALPPLAPLGSTQPHQFAPSIVTHSHSHQLPHPGAPMRAAPVPLPAPSDPMMGRERVMSFEFFSLGINVDEPLPPAPDMALSAFGTLMRPRGDSIIFDPVSFQDGGIHEEKAFFRSRTNSIDLPSTDEMAIMNTPGFIAPAVSVTHQVTHHKPMAPTSYRPQHTTHQKHQSQNSAQMATLPSSLNTSMNHATFQMDLLNKDGRIGIYLPDARKARIAKFHSKRKMRIWRKRIKYDCRKKLADSRPRIKGRFVKRSDMDD